MTQYFFVRYNLANYKRCQVPKIISWGENLSKRELKQKIKRLESYYKNNKIVVCQIIEGSQ